MGGIGVDPRAAEPIWRAPASTLSGTGCIVLPTVFLRRTGGCPAVERVREGRCVLSGLAALLRKPKKEAEREWLGWLTARRGRGCSELG
jgi:hypothetical protein